MPWFRGNRASSAPRAIGWPLARLHHHRAVARSGRWRVKRSIVVAALGTAQTLAWGSSYYLPAILADPIAQGLGLSRTTVFGLFSGALLLSAVLGPSVGRAIDNRGGRGVLALSNLVLATGLVLLGVAQGFSTLALAWAVLGVGMAMGLYDPCVRHPHWALRPLGARTHHRHYPDRRLRQYGRMAVVGLSRCAIRLAHCMSHLGGTAHFDRAAPDRLLIPRAPPPVRACEFEGGRHRLRAARWRSPPDLA